MIYVGTRADEAAREETLKAIFKTPLMYEPGTQDMYSDMDYMILGFCIEKVTGKRLDEFLKETFWEPMGLAQITYNPLENGFKAEDCAATEVMGNSRDGNLSYTGVRTYTLQGEAHDPIAYYCMDGVSGHAGMFSNATDLAKLAYVMLHGGYGEFSFFSRDVIDLFTAPNGTEAAYYGLGWWRDASHDWDRYFGSVTVSRTIGHQGFTGTLTMIDPEQDLVIVFLTNKIHSRLVPGDETLNYYSGNAYTTATLGFVPEIIEIGLEGNDSDLEIYRSLLSAMIADAEVKITEHGITDQTHPEYLAYNALCTVLEQLDK